MFDKVNTKVGGASNTTGQTTLKNPPSNGTKNVQKRQYMTINNEILHIPMQFYFFF